MSDPFVWRPLLVNLPIPTLCVENRAVLRIDRMVNAPGFVACAYWHRLDCERWAHARIRQIVRRVTLNRGHQVILRIRVRCEGRSCAQEN